MKQVAILEPYKIGIVDVPEPELNPRQIKAKTKVTGISIGTELHDYRGSMTKIPEKWKKLHPYTFPVFPGYLNVGEVIEAGSEIKDVKPSDRVVHEGPHAQYCCIPREEALPVYVKVPDSISDEDATLTSMAVTSLWGCLQGNIGFGKKVVVTGDGTIGILAALLTALFGVDKSILVGTHGGKMERARQAGVQTTINHNDADWKEQVMSATDGQGADVVLECVGSMDKSTNSIAEACELARERGRVVVVGYHLAPQTDWILGGDFYFKELTMYNCRAGGPGSHHTFLLDALNRIQQYNFIDWTTTGLFKYILKLMDERKLNVHPLITHRFRYTDIADIFRRLDEQKEDFIHVLLTDW